MDIKIMEKFKSELFFKWIDDVEFRFRLAQCVRKATKRRKECYTQKEVSNIVDIPLTKVKQIEKGTCKDFNAINNYINLFQCEVLDFYFTSLS